jgi:DNA invertase Pin-like site-specific DNA recombinase
LVIACGLTATVLTADLPGDGRSRSRKEIHEERKRLHDKTSAAADQIAAEAHAKLPRSMAQSIGAIYVRFSTLFQDSAIDQIRALYEFAVENKIFIPREHVYFDLGVRGYTSKRDGLDQLRAVLANKKVKVLLLFATNRLFRKVYLTLQFVEQAVTEQGIRCVFVHSRIDTANKDQWQMLLHMRAMMDEFQLKVNAEHIRAAQEGLFLEGYVYGTLPPGYMGEPVPGKLTKRGRPRCRIVLHPDEAKIVILIFEWYVNDGLSLARIAQRLNAIPNVPLPRKSKEWSRGTVRAALKRETYRGLWKFSVTEKTFLPSKDYARQVPREKPLNEATFENLRVVSDALWYAAQVRLGKNSWKRGRKPNGKNEHYDPSVRVINGLFWCPEHGRPLRACSAFAKYLGCSTCATLESESRPLFSKPHRKVVLRLLCDKLAELIRQDEHLVEQIISATQAQSAAVQRPDASAIKQLEKTVAELTRTINFNMQNPGETEEDEREIAETLRNLRRERKAIQDQLGLVKAAAANPVRVPTEEEVNQLLDRFSDVLQCAAAGKLGDDQETARAVLESLTGGRIEMFQQGEREEMHGWLQRRFTIKLLDVLVEKLVGVRPAASGERIEVVIDFKRTRKTDTDADKAIQWWIDGDLNKEIANKLGTVESYITRLLRIGAERRSTTLEALRSQRKTRPTEPSEIPRYKVISDEVKALWWDELFPVAAVAKQLTCSTGTVEAAKQWWYESQGQAVPTFEEWSRELERRVLEMFDRNDLKFYEIAEKVHRAHGTVKQIVNEAYRRIGKELPDGRTRRMRLHANPATVSDPAP